MLLEGEALQVVQEMRRRADTVANQDSAVREISYFGNNLSRMGYDTYKAQGFPIGSGLVRGSYKFVVAKHFKGSGMRCKREDNIRVLRVRVEKLNAHLHHYFKPKRQKWIAVSAAA